MLGQMAEAKRIMLISGSLRTGSTNTATILTAAAVAPDTLLPVVYEGMAELPHFNPDDDPADGSKELHPAVVDMRSRLKESSAVLLSTPEYAGALPGSFKNLLDWTVGSGETDGLPVAWINSSASPTQAADAHASLRKVLGFIGARVMEEANAHIPVPRGVVGPDGLIEDRAIRDQIAQTLHRLEQALN